MSTGSNLFAARVPSHGANLTVTVHGRAVREELSMLRQHDSNYVSWVQSWVQLKVLFQPKNGVKLRQINESVDGS